MDIKSLASDISEEIAVKLYGRGFYDLSEYRQNHVYSLALLDASDKIADWVDDLIDGEKDEDM